MTWPNAEENCEQKGAHLVAIESEEEYNFLTEKLDSLLRDPYWAGFWTAGKQSGSTWIWDVPGIGKFSSGVCLLQCKVSKNPIHVELFFLKFML